MQEDAEVDDMRPGDTANRLTSILESFNEWREDTGYDSGESIDANAEREWCSRYASLTKEEYVTHADALDVLDAQSATPRILHIPCLVMRLAGLGRGESGDSSACTHVLMCNSM